MARRGADDAEAGMIDAVASGLPASVRLTASGTIAELRRDDLTDAGVVLAIDGAEQSHVEVDDPEVLLHDYTVRKAAILRTAARELASPHAGGTALHLGAGALTMPRWLAHRAPGLEHTVVDIEPELVDFVLEHVPMRPAPRSIVADAARVFDDGALAGEQFDIMMVDLFNSSEAPEALTSTAFHRTTLGATAEGGLLLMNLGDEPPMDFAAEQVRRVAQALDLLDAAQDDGGDGADGGDRGDDLWGRLLLTAPADVVAGEAEGNLVLAVSPQAPFLETTLNAVWASGPHPGETLTGAALRDWAG
ncbi:spermidine synthase [Nesterenkonia sp. F]|uniref:spermidine synthase n=1 Tax=Nesterenkonia sp. F TaxID=795955 RepID=UPI000255C9EE|nr:fused MFS/spermidine synthase [Nesterenkonia sp. F]